MKVSGSEINLQSSHTLVETRERSESLTIWQDRVTETADTLTLSKQAESLLASAPLPTYPADTEELTLSEEDQLKIKLIEHFIKTLTGKEFKIRIPNLKLQDQQAQSSGTNTPTQERLGWGLIYQAQEEVSEKENLSFSARGLVTTADGRAIALDLQLNMSREFYARTDFALRMGDSAKVDPLVINFGGTAPTLSTNKYTFDLDHNGTAEQISFLVGDSGFLALDKNNDGLINNGGELFGPQSGNGFTDLALFDEDGNAWIDENDPIYSRLRIWTKDEAGQDNLLVLGQAGVGAIYVGHISSPFALKDGANLLGQIQETGLFLGEDGHVGTVQHLDLAV